MAWQHGTLHPGFMALSQSQSTNNINQTNSRQRWFFLPKLLLLIVLINEVRPEIVILARLYSVLTPGHRDCGTTGCRNGAEVLCNIYTKCQWTPRRTIGSWGGGGRRWTKISGKITKSNHNSLIILGFWLPMGNSLENASLVIPWCHLIPHNPSCECSGHVLVKIWLNRLVPLLIQRFSLLISFWDFGYFCSSSRGVYRQASRVETWNIMIIDISTPIISI